MLMISKRSVKCLSNS